MALGWCAAALLAVAAPAASAMTIDEYLLQRDQADISAQRSLTDIFEGIRDAFYAANETLKAVEVEVFCPPPGGRMMDVAELRRKTDEVLADAEGQPDFATYRRNGLLAQAALAALNRTYVCGQEAAPVEVAPGGTGR